MLEKLKTLLGNLITGGKNKLKALACEKLDAEKPVLAQLIREQVERNLNPDQLAGVVIDRVKDLVNKL